MKAIVAGVAFGLASFLFATLSHNIKHYSNRLVPVKWLVPAIGGLVIIALTYAVGTRDYLGLGVTSESPGGVSIVNAFNAGGADTWSWLLKIVFTAITLGMGFKGGEVTPLFFIGATLGNTLAGVLGAPVDLLAGLGFIAVFAGATNTPLACTLMGVELFGADHVLYYAVACFTAYYFSGHTGIYQSQRISVSKKYLWESVSENDNALTGKKP
jgi:H+/Cl- antiporter ClcA